MTTTHLFLLHIGSLLGIFLIVKNRKRILSTSRILALKNKKSEDKVLQEPSVSSSEKTEIKEKIPSLSLSETNKLIQKAEILLSYEDNKEAEKILLFILSYNENHRDSLRLLSSLYMKQKLFLKAENILRDLIKLEHKKNPSTLSNLGYCLFQQNQIKDAKIFYQNALRLDPKSPLRHSNLGQVLFALQEFDEAISCFLFAYKAKPKDTQTMFLLADTYKAKGDTQNAREMYEKILFYEPYNNEAREEIIYLR
jgi:tetratricopeptide (TPR) repeat protein